MSKGFGRKKKRQLQLESRKDKLQKLNQIIPWQIFVRKIEQSLKKERKSKAGRKPKSARNTVQVVNFATVI